VLILGCRASGVDASSDGRGKNYGPTDKSIRAWNFTGIEHPQAEILDSEDGYTGTIAVSVPYGTDLTNLTAEIDLAAPSINPQPGAALNYSSPVQFTVTPEEGEPRVYTVTVTHLPNETAAITTIYVSGMTGATFSGQNITVTLPYNTDISAIAPTFTLSEGANITPNIAQNFAYAPNNTITYTVRAANNITMADYNVKMKVSANDAKRITSFTVNGVSDAVNALIETEINDDAGTIAVCLPYGLSTTFTPAIAYEGSSINPDPVAVPAPVDFSSSKGYTVTAGDTTNKTYTVSVSNKNPIQVDLNGVTANGVTDTLATTQLTLNFDAGVPTLTAEDITLSGTKTYVKGNLESGLNDSWILGISGSWDQGNVVTVAVTDPIGYTIRYDSKQATLNREPTLIIYKANGPALPDTAGPAASAVLENMFTNSGKVFKEWNTQANGQGTTYYPGATYEGYVHLDLYAIWLNDDPNLEVKFGTSGVAATFNAVAAYIRTTPNQSGTGADMMLGAIKIGDFVELPTLVVDAYSGSGGFSKSNPKVAVVGINPYTGKNDNAAGAHLVFQFEKTMVDMKMNGSDNDSTGVGYAKSQMRQYLTPEPAGEGDGKFYNGLVTAGVPEGVFWAPVRVIAAPPEGNPDTIQDKVFLPTLWEVSGGIVDTLAASPALGTLTTGETDENQGRLSAYGDGFNGNSSRDKAGSTWWWLASPTAVLLTYVVCGGSCLPNSSANASHGVAPAFCIK
jgi:hypothetical protein